MYKICKVRRTFELLLLNAHDFSKKLHTHKWNVTDIHPCHFPDFQFLKDPLEYFVIFNMQYFSSALTKFTIFEYD